MQIPVAVIIPNRNGVRLLGNCLSALVGQTYPITEIVLVDNASSDDSLRLIAQHFPQVTVVRNDTNRGFAAAVNQAIRATQTPLVATLNNDTVVEPDWLSNLVEAIALHPEAGMAASKMLFVMPPGIINSAGICLDRAGIAWDRDGGQPDNPLPAVVCEVFGACAGAALYRRSMFDDIGLFDEDFFAYHEDVDLAWRAQLAGWRAIYVPKARVAHWHSTTSVDGSAFKNMLLGRNKIWTIAKNYPAPQVILYGPAIIAFDVAALAFATLTSRNLSSLRGRLASLRGMRSALRKRWQVQRMRRSPKSAVLARMEALTSPGAVLRRFRHLSAGKRREPSNIRL